MSTTSETSDAQLLELLAQQGPMSVAALAGAMNVTATAVRQRLTRLMAQDLIERDVARSGRGRPSHRYSLTSKARRQVGTNFADLALVLWNEVRAIEDEQVRRGLLQRIAQSLATMYGEDVSGTTLATRLASLRELFAKRRIPLSVNESDGLTVLTVHQCPYPELAEQDRGICAAERLLFSELVDERLRLSQCRLDGANCCQFETV
jgi:predicted ArsR family transcriptional regulator